MWKRNRFVEELIRDKNPGFVEVELELRLDRDDNAISLGEGSSRTGYLLRLIADNPEKTVDLTSSKDSLRDSRRLMKSLSLALGIPAREKRDGTEFVYRPADWGKRLCDFVDEGRFHLPDSLGEEPPYVTLEADGKIIRLKIEGPGKGSRRIAFLFFFAAPALLWGSVCWFMGHPFGGLSAAAVLLLLGWWVALNGSYGDEYIEIGEDFLSVYTLAPGKKKRTDEWNTPIASITRIGGPLAEIIADIDGCPVGDHLIFGKSHAWLRKFLVAAVYKLQSRRIPSAVEG